MEHLHKKETLFAINQVHQHSCMVMFKWATFKYCQEAVPLQARFWCKKSAGYILCPTGRGISFAILPLLEFISSFTLGNLYYVCPVRDCTQLLKQLTQGVSQGLYKGVPKQNFPLQCIVRKWQIEKTGCSFKTGGPKDSLELISVEN